MIKRQQKKNRNCVPFSEFGNCDLIFIALENGYFKRIFSLNFFISPKQKSKILLVMGIKGRRVHMIEELSETIISFQRGNNKKK